METVLCPTRGGEASVPNQLKAIALAKERGVHLIFLHVSDVQFLSMMASPVLVNVEAELEEMGEFLLAMAQERAEKAGIHADALVRHGIFLQALQDVIKEYQVSTVVLGVSPEGRGFTNREYLSNLVDRLLTETPVEVFLVQEGRIIEHHIP